VTVKKVEAQERQVVGWEVGSTSLRVVVAFSIT
jgi:hypothetical protein